MAACHRANSDAPVAAMFTDDHGLLVVSAASPLRSRLAVRAVGQGAAGGALELPAAIEADPSRVANVLAPLTGRVAALKVALGEHVKRGQVLAILASGDFAQAFADDDKARDAVDLAKRALDRARGVGEAGGAAQKDLEAAQSTYNQAQAELVRTRARLQSLNRGAGYRSRELTLTAPQSGVVTSLAVAPGAQVDDPNAVLMTVTNLDRVFVTANVAERDIGKVVVGSDAEIVLNADPGRPIRARITQVTPVVDADTRRQKVRIALANADCRLLPNMYATVRVAGREAGGVFVPQSALLMNNDAVSVLVETRPWVFRRQAVQIGDETETSANILSGLKAGDRVVVRGGILLND
jgi:cobalt-zinc-cadmium efflux system membrane fusion protein